MFFMLGDDFTDLFRHCQRSAFHLELQDTYTTPEEAEPFNLFLAGQPDDYAWMQGWTDLVSDTAKRGVTFQRVRVVTEPLVDYQRWTLAVSRLNIEAGEDIRYLPRHLTASDELPIDDYWLFDDEAVAFTLFTQDGAAAGAAVTTDSAIVQRSIDVAEAVWSRATPHDQYVRTTVGS
ncbi:DUF6879 family protein [Nocardia sp. XZ_19_385]|uniref:DUF6879 family protein n=1 Tax=Nocardia sp. XZ_19_385 TaxID=2769488 RepID=UPI00189002AD|nr:DUF6879 family protein [Nocardia sp. XZ_19_385]